MGTNGEQHIHFTTDHWVGDKNYVKRNDVVRKLLRQGTLTFVVCIKPHSHYYCHDDKQQSSLSDDMASNVINHLLYADSNSLSLLKKAAINFITDNQKTSLNHFHF